jgi:hypothetical protein
MNVMKGDNNMTAQQNEAKKLVNILHEHGVEAWDDGEDIIVRDIYTNADGAEVAEEIALLPHKSSVLEFLGY